MREHTEFNLVKWPFLLGDALLLSVAYLIFRQSAWPMVFWQVGLAVVCVAGGACLAITPFLQEYRVMAGLAQARERTTALDQLGMLEGATAQVRAATGQWQRVQEEVGKTATTAKEIAEQIRGEIQGFTELIQSINDKEKAELRLELEEQRRLEAACLQALVRVLDHVYALQVGALRSGQPNLIEQVSNFQDACREAPRPIGLIPFLAEPAEPFDAARHQRPDGEGPVSAQSTVAETIATGYTFKGRLLRRALVRLLRSDETQSAEDQTEDR